LRLFRLQTAGAKLPAFLIFLANQHQIPRLILYSDDNSDTTRAPLYLWQLANTDVAEINGGWIAMLQVRQHDHLPVGGHTLLKLLQQRFPFGLPSMPTSVKDDVSPYESESEPH